MPDLSKSEPPKRAVEPVPEIPTEVASKRRKADPESKVAKPKRVSSLSLFDFAGT